MTRTHHVASLGGLSHLDLWELGQGGLGAPMWARELCDHLGVYIELGVPNEEEVLIENEVAREFQVRGHHGVPRHSEIRGDGGVPRHCEVRGDGGVPRNGEV